jgi:hypothetical protein
VNGTFASLKSAANVFLDASLGYDTGSVYLNINRIDVSKAVASLGLSSGIVTASAARLESAMQAIDGQLAGGGGSISGFIDGAGALQQLPARRPNAPCATVRELHAQADAATFDSIAANARTLSSRRPGRSRPLSAMVPACRWTGARRWRPGPSEGWMMGSDARFPAA